jgi:hypothetical protein
VGQRRRRQVLEEDQQADTQQADQEDHHRVLSFGLAPDQLRLDLGLVDGVECGAFERIAGRRQAMAESVGGRQDRR